MEILTFFLGDEKFAIDITSVDAIENVLPLTPVPKAEAYVKGLINIRGNVIPVVDIGMLLQRNSDCEDFQKLVVTNLNNNKLALAVGDVDEVLNIEDEKIEVISKDKDISVVNIDGDIITLLTQKKLCNIQN